MQFHSASIRYNDTEEIFFPGKMTFFDECYIDFQIEETSTYQRHKITVHPKQDIQLQALELIFQLSIQPTDRLFCNGYQSWSESREYSPEESIEPLRPIAKKWLKYAGDQQFSNINKGKGWLHSWTYTYQRRIGKTFIFFGSLREDTAFTLFQYDLKLNQLIIKKDIEDLTLSHSFPVLDVVFLSGKEDQVFGTWVSLMENEPPLSPHLTGWTSWYQHYTDVTEEIVLENTRAFSELNSPIDIIQIDDGYQEAVGDWLNIKSSFPNGMASLAQKIHEHGFKAGLWLAPFVCDQRSEIFKKHQDWLLKDATGNLVKAGYIPLWKGWFYALDFYNKQVQEYLTGVLFTALNKWNYDLLKLDFLYAVCLCPPKGKTRGQVMHEAMQFLRHNMENKLMLACGVPLASAFHCADYCRIGGDIHLQWENRLPNFLRHRERVSTISSLNSTISRRQLNGRVFHNDPDVFILREENNQLSPDQQYSILLINRLLGNLLFTSDNPKKYSPETLSELQLIFELKNTKVQWVESFGKDRYRIDCMQQAKNYAVFCNLSNKEWRVDGFTLTPFESLIHRKTPKNSK